MTQLALGRAPESGDSPLRSASGGFTCEAMTQLDINAVQTRAYVRYELIPIYVARSMRNNAYWSNEQWKNRALVQRIIIKG